MIIVGKERKAESPFQGGNSLTPVNERLGPSLARSKNYILLFVQHNVCWHWRSNIVCLKSIL